MVTNRDRKWCLSRRKNPKVAQMTFLIRLRAFRDPLRGELPYVQIFMNDGLNLLTWDAQLLSYWFSRNSAGMVSVLCHPGRGASQVEKFPRLNWAIQFLTVTYDGACSPNVSVRMAWISFCALPWRKKKLDGSSRHHVVETAFVAWNASFQPV